MNRPTPPDGAEAPPVLALDAPRCWQPAPVAGVCDRCSGVYRAGSIVRPEGSRWRCAGCAPPVTQPLHTGAARAAQ